jgi:hypothetical protein
MSGAGDCNSPTNEHVESASGTTSFTGTSSSNSYQYPSVLDLTSPNLPTGAIPEAKARVRFVQRCTSSIVTGMWTERAQSVHRAERQKLVMETMLIIHQTMTITLKTSLATGGNQGSMQSLQISQISTDLNDKLHTAK